MVGPLGMERSLQERDRTGVQDSVLLEDFNSEDAFIDNLKKRFNEDIIYTYIGQVLVSVNPYQNLPLYSQDAIQAYQKVHYFEAPPHIYAVTDTAYRSLTQEHRGQCILISGESGSGKTEASKKILEFVADVSGHRAGGRVRVVRDRLLQSNPVLEAFGNAKTNRNDNSSRFGKYMDIAFNCKGDPVGGNILNYLLEKSRVVHQGEGERNFNVFYQLLAGANDALLTSLHLHRDLEKYTYLTHSAEPDLDDAAHYERMRQAMNVIELSAAEQREMFTIVASVLHLGNVGFVEEDSQVRLSNMSPVHLVAQLLVCSESTLSRALSHRTIDANGDVVITPLNREQAVYARDALAKAIYDRLFSWLVQRLNTSLQSSNGMTKDSVMGILDIYGFEIFQRNSFEQFCINYCNEKLHQLFIELTLKSEQEEYLKEGIAWEPVTYFNNKVICDLIEEKHKGIISIMDEECLRPGEPTDYSFLQKMTGALQNHKHFISHSIADKQAKKTMEREEFKLVHYAGEVSYSIHGFLDKNNDLLFRDLRLVMSNSENSIIQKVFPASELSSKKRPETAITQFKNSLSQLMEILSSKEPSYIRCIKPNDLKKPGLFDNRIVSHQVKYLGLMENLRVRRAGFAYRRHYKEFLGRYKSLCRETWPHYEGQAKEGVQALMIALKIHPDHYRIGNTKIFIRFAKTLFDIEDAFQLKKQVLAAKLQAQWRGYVQRQQYKQLRAAAIVVQCWCRRYLAQLAAQRRRIAITAIRNFIKGFITRSGPQTELNYKFIQLARKQYLLRLAHSLPQTLLVHYWPVAPHICHDASRELHKLHRAWLARKYRLALSPEHKRQMELKVLAESLFKGKKKSYAETVGPWFVQDRLVTEAHRHLKAHFQSSMPSTEQLLYSSPVHKFDRHGYKKRDRILLLTPTTLFLVVEDGKHFKTKHRLPMEAVTRLEVTSQLDRFILLRLSPEQQKTDKGDLILEMPNVIEFVTAVISSTNNPDLLNINNVENGQITHMLSDGTEGKIDLTLGQNGPTITRSKNGHLIVVG